MASIPVHIHLDAHKIAQEVIGAVRVEVDDFARNLRATVAEEIAQAIEDLAEACDESEESFKVAYAVAAQVARLVAARGHSAGAATDTAEGRPRSSSAIAQRSPISKAEAIAITRGAGHD